MVNQQIEREQVLKPCLALCKKLKICGYILKYRRLDALDYYHESGDPDIEIWIPKDKIVLILMAECKKIGGVISPSQISCRDKYKNFINVRYEIIIDPAQLKKIVLELSDYGTEGIEEFKEFNL